MNEYHEYDPAGHIRAIAALAKKAKELTEEQSNRLKDFNYSAHGQHADDMYGDDFYMSVYFDAAYSHMVASGLGTFFESFFFHEFWNMKSAYPPKSPINSSPRWKLPEKHFWNPNKVSEPNGTLSKKANFAEGIQQLFNALDLSLSIPDDKWIKIKTLFHYRNYMAHNGFEWRKNKISEFEDLIRRLGTMDCFSRATSGGETWILYMTKDFTEELIKLAYQCVQEFDKWFWNRIEIFQQ